MQRIRQLMITILAFSMTFGVARADEHALFTTQSLVPEIALKAMQASLESCRAKGFQVAVAVVDRMGNLQSLVRDRYAGAHTSDTARRKAWTATSFRTNTSELVDLTQPGQTQSGVRHVGGALMLGGGVLIEAGGSLVGAIGVSGAPSGADDDACALAGIEAIEDDISF